MAKAESMFKQTRWSLKDLFPSSDSPEFKRAHTELESNVLEFEKVRKELKDDVPSERFLEIIALLE